jgi:hypothetical protein
MFPPLCQHVQVYFVAFHVVDATQPSTLLLRSCQNSTYFLVHDHLHDPDHWNKLYSWMKLNALMTV